MAKSDNNESQVFALPDLGEGLQAAEIVAWHIAVGDHVVADQPLVSVETDKAVVEIPSPQAGRIAKLCGKPGERLNVGDPLVEFEQGAHVDAGAVVGEIKTDTALSPPFSRPESAVQAGRVRTTPAVRALAKKLAVDLAMVHPSGPDGSITKADVERAAKTLAEATPPIPLSGVRLAMAERMARAHAEVVPATINAEADVNAWIYAQGDVMSRLIRAVAAGCKAAPALNAWFDGKSMSRRLHDNIDLGIAVNTEDGLFVPTLRDIAKRFPGDIKQALQRLKSDVRNRTVPLEELRGQTITLSNFGTIAGRFASLVVVPPQVAILGAGRIASRVVAVADQPAVHKILPLSLTFDHRAVTGGEAAQFLAAAIIDLELPE